MDNNKVKELIAELESEVRSKVNAISALKALLLEGGAVQQEALPLITPLEIASMGSYVDMAVSALESRGGSMHIKQIVEYIRLHKHNPNIARRSIEASLLQHIKTKGDSSRVTKTSPGVYALRRFPRRAEPAA